MSTTSASPVAPSAAVATASGAFVVLVGPDGVGKTSVARELVSRRPGRARYFHFRPAVRRPLDRTVPGPGPSIAKARGGGSRVAGVLRLLRSAAHGWVAYLVRIRPAVRAGELVVGDRWLYGYVGQPQSLRFHGPDPLARMIVRLLPRPDLVVKLVAPPEVIVQRKQELTIDEVRAELARWDMLPVGNGLTLACDVPPADVADAVLAALGRAEP